MNDSNGSPHRRRRIAESLSIVGVFMQVVLGVLGILLVPWVTNVNKNLESLNVNLARLDERVSNIDDMRQKHEAMSERLRLLELQIAQHKSETK